MRFSESVLKLCAALLLSLALPTAQATDASSKESESVEPAPASVAPWFEQGQVALVGGLFDQSLQLFRKAAALGSSAALSAMGELYQSGLGVAQSAREALLWYRKAAATGDAEGQAHLGLALVRHGTAAELKTGLALIRQSIAANSSFGQYALGYLHLHGKGVPRDEDLAYSLLNAASGRGEVAAQSLLGQMYLDGKGVQKHSAMALELLSEAARSGDAQAQSRLGAVFAEGWGVERNEHEAAYWFERAGERGNLDGQTRLAVLLLDGEQVRTDPLKAIELLRQAATAGHALAQFHLALCFLQGRGVPQDPAQGQSLLRQLAKACLPEASSYLKEHSL